MVGLQLKDRVRIWKRHFIDKGVKLPAHQTNLIAIQGELEAKREAGKIQKWLREHNEVFTSSEKRTVKVKKKVVVVDPVTKKQEEKEVVVEELTGLGKVLKSMENTGEALQKVERKHFKDPDPVPKPSAGLNPLFIVVPVAAIAAFMFMRK